MRWRSASPTAVEYCLSAHTMLGRRPALTMRVRGASSACRDPKLNAAVRWPSSWWIEGCLSDAEISGRPAAGLNDGEMPSRAHVAINNSQTFQQPQPRCDSAEGSGGYQLTPAAHPVGMRRFGARRLAASAFEIVFARIPRFSKNDRGSLFLFVKSDR